jgi:single-stranded-DNA-specific exonuclease
MHAQAVEALRALELAEDGGALPPCLCLYDPGWHQGVVGLLASRIKDRLHRPVVAFAPGEQDSLKGSARSVSGLHIRDALDSVAAGHPGLLQKFGGHAMAAGLSLRLQDLEQFRAALIAEVERREADMDCRGTLWSDGELRASEISLATAETLREAMPWGQHFPEPLFDGEFRLEDRRIVGERHLRLKLRPRGAGGRALDAIAFNYDAAGLPEGDALRLVFRLDVNDYRGLRSPQLIVEYLESL